MADPAPRPKLPIVDGGAVQAMGALGIQKNTEPAVCDCAIVALNSGAAPQFTLVTNIANSPPLETGGVYELCISAIAPTDVTVLFEIGFGNSTNPVTGDFPANPSAGAAVVALGWVPAQEPVYRFVALEGQRFLALKQVVGTTAAAVLVIRRRR